MSHLDRDILKAHAAQDTPALVHLYTQVADLKEHLGDTEATCFFLTHAYVFALEAGAPEAAALNRRLVQYGREDHQPDLEATT